MLSGGSGLTRPTGGDVTRCDVVCFAVFCSMLWCVVLCCSAMCIALYRTAVICDAMHAMLRFAMQRHAVILDTLGQAAKWCLHVRNSNVKAFSSEQNSS